MSKIRWMRDMGENENYTHSTRTEGADVRQQYGEEKWRAEVSLVDDDGLELSFSQRDFPSPAVAKAWAVDRLIRAQMFRDEVSRILAL